MRYIDYNVEVVQIYDRFGSLKCKDFPLRNLFDTNAYVDKINVGQKEKFFSNLRSYIRSGARPEFISNFDLPDKDYVEIEKYYNSEIFQDMRSAISEVCCMCGGFVPTQLDHILDKNLYKSYFSFFRNLASVCACNQSKKPSKGTRWTLHPYIDTILKKRIVKFKYLKKEADGFSAVKVVPVEGFGDVKAVVNHIDSVFRGATMKRAAQSAGKRFEEVIRKCGNNANDIFDYCVQQHNDNYKRYKTPNNWNSMAYIGVMDFYGIQYECIK